MPNQQGEQPSACNRGTLFACKLPPQDRAACALFMFPTKALAQDQLRALRELAAAAFGDAAPAVDIYDGDTPMGDR